LNQRADILHLRSAISFTHVNCLAGLFVDESYPALDRTEVLTGFLALSVAMRLPGSSLLVVLPGSRWSSDNWCGHTGIEITDFVTARF